MARVGRYATAQGQGLRAVRLPYADERASMLVVVPDQLAGFERSMTTATVDGIAPAAKGRLYLSLVQHEAWVKVDEDGTEAAAAAGAVVDAASALLPPTPSGSTSRSSSSSGTTPPAPSSSSGRSPTRAPPPSSGYA
jgi:serine protease inhibitor